MTDLTTKTSAPNSIAALVMGILSWCFCALYIGIIFGIIGLVMAGKGFKQFNANPEIYSGKGMLIAGKVLSIIGIVVSSLMILYTIIFVAILGTASSFLF